jgi:dTDP-4-dehydrorhamnose 3,5-epimerase
MIFTPTKLPGAFIIEPEKVEDDRGFFARSWCRREFESNGLNSKMVQCNISGSRKKATLRGMHYQVAPMEEAKLIRCTSGSIYDVIIDMRPNSRTFKQHVGITLTGTDHTMLYVPEGFAHGFLTLEDDTEVFYQMSEFYSPKHARGVRWDDSAFGISWPNCPTIISERDRSWPDVGT